MGSVGETEMAVGMAVKHEVTTEEATAGAPHLHAELEDALLTVAKWLSG